MRVEAVSRSTHRKFGRPADELGTLRLRRPASLAGAMIRGTHVADEWVRGREAARLLGVSKSTINRWAKVGDLPSATIADVRVFRRSDLRLLAKARQRAGDPSGLIAAALRDGAAS